jgi:hypothetical protein
MDLVGRLLANAPDDPWLLVATAILAWLPACALVLGVLVLVSAVQRHLDSRRRARPAIVLPPREVRPLAGRRYASTPPRPSPMLAMARIVLAIGVVVLFTAVAFAANGRPLLATLRH